MTSTIVVPDVTDKATNAAIAPPDPQLPTLAPRDPSRDAEIVNRIMFLLDTARQAKAPLIPRWRNNYRMMFNRFWDVRKRQPWMPTPSTPEIFPIVRAITGFMVDQRITNTIAPATLPMQPFTDYMNGLAQDLEVAMDASWQTNNEEREWTMTIEDGFLYGTGFTKTSWESNLGGGLGDAMTRHIHPFFIYPDPHATTEHDLDYIIEHRRMSVQELDRRFPGAAERFPAGMLSTPYEAPPSILDPLNGVGGEINTYANPGTTPTTYFSQRDGSHSISPDTLTAVDVLECWMREHTYEMVKDDRTDTVTRKFANESWRVIVIAGNQVLMDEPAPNLWRHAGHPYSRFVAMDLGEFWGPSLVEQLISPQQSINRLLASLEWNIELTGNPIWKETETSGLPRQPIANKPGQRVTVQNTPGSKNVGWEAPPQLNPTMLQLVDFYLSRMMIVAGMTDIMQGAAPGGRTPEGVVDAVQESGFVGIRLAQQNLEYSMRNAGTMRADLITENYTVPRLVPSAGPRGERAALALKARHFQLAGPNGAMPFKYQLLVDAGSRGHTARAKVEQRAMELFGLGAIDRAALLEAIAFPKAQEVAQRTEAAIAAEEQAAATSHQQARAM